MSPEVAVEADGPLLTVVFDRPEKRNALSPAMLAGLRDALDRLGDDDDVRVLLVRAEGDDFSSGIDISGGMDPGRRRDGTPSGTSGPRNPQRGSDRRGYRRLHALFDRAEEVEKPVVLAAQGRCFGAGLELALSCDFRLAAADATFALPELKLGVIPGSGGISRLVRTVGPAWARWMAMAAQPVPASQALAMGLVHAVHPRAELAERATAFARSLAELPGEAVGLAKLAIDTVDGFDRARGRDVERVVNSLLIGAEEHRARLAQFTGRRRRPTADPAEER